MSKAFTKEDGESPGDALVRPPPRMAAGETRYLTREGAQALRDERDRLGEERAAAREGATLEQAARVKEIDSRLRQIEGILGAATIAPSEDDGGGRALFGAWVTLEDDSGARTTWRIVGPDEADARALRVSVSSPLGRALLGKREGDEVEVQRPRGTASFTILSVSAREPQPH